MFRCLSGQTQGVKTALHSLPTDFVRTFPQVFFFCGNCRFVISPFFVVGCSRLHMLVFGFFDFHGGC